MGRNVGEEERIGIGMCGEEEQRREDLRVEKRDGDGFRARHLCLFLTRRVWPWDIDSQSEPKVRAYKKLERNATQSRRVCQTQFSR